MDKILEVKHLKKSYGKVQAVKDISFYAERGKLFAFLGPNGAGKSTTIDIICTLLQKDGGEVIVDSKVLGEEDDEIRKKIGVVFQDSLLDGLLTVDENLRLRGRLYGQSEAEWKRALQNAIEATDIASFLRQPYGKLSGGQRRRADIARALLSSPQILILDEPTTGLDPQTRKSIWETIRSLQQQTGMTVFLTTHYMEEAANSDYAIILDGGQVVAKGTPAMLKTQYARDTLRLLPSDKAALCNKLASLEIEYSTAVDELVLPLRTCFDALELVTACRPFLQSFEVARGDMDDVFINITGRKIRE